MSASSPSSGFFPNRLSPDPKRRNINPSPGSRGARGQMGGNATKKHLANDDDIGLHTLLDPPQLNCKTIAESMVFPQPTSNINKAASNYPHKEEVDLHPTNVMKGLELALGIPIGPCRTVEELHNLINEWAKNPSNGGGSFSVKRFSSNAPTKFRGPQCHRCPHNFIIQGCKQPLKQGEEGNRTSKSCKSLGYDVI